MCKKSEIYIKETNLCESICEKGEKYNEIRNEWLICNEREKYKKETNECESICKKEEIYDLINIFSFHIYLFFHWMFLYLNTHFF